MPTYGDPPWGQWNTGHSYSIDYNTITTTADTSVQFIPGVMTVSQAPQPEPVDDSPLAWLRRQVDEITELARAA